MRKEEVEGLVLWCGNLADKAHASYVFAQQGGGIKLDAELEKAEDFKKEIREKVRQETEKAGKKEVELPVEQGTAHAPDATGIGPFDFVPQ